MEDPTPFFIMGMMVGTLVTLLVQFYGRRKVRQAGAKAPLDIRATTLLADENERQSGMILRLEERIAVMERIATDPAERVHREIERLRLEGN